MKLELGLHDVYFAVIGARETSQGETKRSSFALATRRSVAQKRAQRIYDLWLTQPGGFWTLEGYHQAKQIAKGLV